MLRQTQIVDLAPSGHGAGLGNDVRRPQEVGPVPIARGNSWTD